MADRLLDPALTRDCLAKLRATNANVFGASLHHFLLNPPLTESVASDFERQHRIMLPFEYRHFLTQIGNGGAGPYYGVFPLGNRDADVGSGLQPWHEGSGLVGVLSESFPHETAWNDLSGQPPDELLDRDEAAYSRQLDDFEKTYFRNSLVNGAIPVCHEGCALRIWLVVAGNQIGRLWLDGRAENAGLRPLLLRNGSPATFSAWYDEWLTDALATITR